MTLLTSYMQISVDQRKRRNNSTFAFEGIPKVRF